MTRTMERRTAASKDTSTIQAMLRVEADEVDGSGVVIMDGSSQPNVEECGKRHERGYKDAEIEKILYGNWMRLFKELL